MSEFRPPPNYSLLGGGAEVGRFFRRTLERAFDPEGQSVMRGTVKKYKTTGCQSVISRA